MIRFLLLCFLAGCASLRPPAAPAAPPGRLRWVEGLPVLFLSGTPYQIGVQHGTLLKEEVRASVANMIGFVDREVGIPVVGGFLARRTLAQAWEQMEPFISPEIQQELEGLSDGSGIPLKTLQQIHALPELMAASCASFAAFGKATTDGRLIQIRNLDWAIQSEVQRYSALFVIHPQGKHPFLNIGWLGFIGAISGINAQGVSISEIGAETQDVDLKGVPMPFLLRRVLEEAEDLDEAVAFVCGATRAGGYNYLFADAKSKHAVAVETTKSRCAVFWADQEPETPYAVFVPNAVLRSDWALDPTVRDRQLAAKGDPKRPGLEPPVGSKAYDVRYAGQGQLLLQFHGRIDPEIAMAIAKAIAPSSNIQSIVYAYPQLWVANAQQKQPAAMGRYLQLDAKALLDETGD